MTRRFGTLALTLALLFPLLGTGCGDDDSPPATDAGSDAGETDAAGMDAAELDAGPQDIQIPGLTGEVEAIQDDRGMWHIYADNVDDAFRAEGYLMARDRWGQMDFIRRSVEGRIAEIAGALGGCEAGDECGFYLDDVGARFQGHARNAAIMWDTLSTEEQALLQAYADGVNVYLAQLRSGERSLPRGVSATFAAVMLEPEDWTPLNTLAIARYQAAALSYDPGDDIGMSRALAAWEAAFPSSSTDPRIAARAGGFHDLFPFRQVQPVYTRDGFPNVATDSGSRAIRLPRLTHRDLPSPDVLRAAWAVSERFEASFQRFFGDETRGSNSWVVHGEHTASGNPILSNDPHLQLSSPPLFWMVHLNTKREGGDWNVAGLALVGTPAVLLGYNDDIAWGLTTHGFDVTDVYRENITAGTGGAADTVEFDGGQVAIETITETIEVKVVQDGAFVTEDREVTFERVPHHGLIMPNLLSDGARTASEGVSVRWTGNEATRELWAFVALATATNVEDARDAYENFGVGGQNLVVVDQDDIYWTTQVHLPVRDARALSYDPSTRTGIAPCFVLPGTGEYEWTGMLSDRYLPHDLNPANGYIATANNDGVGSVDDGNPFDDDHYIGWTFAAGHRIARIRERLDELVARGNITPDEMSALQGDALSPIGRLTRDAIVSELDRALAEAATVGTHPDLTALVAGLDAATVATVQSARDRLAAWSFDTPAAVEGTPDAAQLADSVATTLFNTTMGRMHRALIDDEIEHLYGGTGGPDVRDQVYIWALTQPEQLASWDATGGDTVLWDDLRTDTVTETRGMIVLSALLDALTWLSTPADMDGAGLGTDMDGWQWGRLHTLRFETQIPQIGGDVLSIPIAEDWIVPGGWPRHGDRGVIDASSFSARAATNFAYGSGPQQRLVVEMTPEGPQISNALPGGQAQDPDDAHHADEAEHWRNNQAPAMYFTDTDVNAHAESSMTFLP